MMLTTLFCYPKRGVSPAGGGRGWTYERQILTIICRSKSLTRTKAFNQALWLLIIMVALACQKEVLIQPKSSFEEQLFIESILYPDEVPRVYLSISHSFFSEKVTPQEIFARDAQVHISGNGQIEALHADSTFDKFRCRWVPYYEGTVPVTYGATYELSVTYAGKTYTAATTIDQAAIEIDEVEYTPEFYDVYGGHDGVIIRFQDAPGAGNFYRFQMDRMIDTSRYHAHVLDVLERKNTCTNGEKFPITDLGRTIFSDETIDGRQLELYLEVSFEYRRGDSAYVMIQSLDAASAAFFSDLDNQLQAILNPFVEPVFVHSKIDGAFGVFGSAVRSEPVLFIYPRDNP